MKRNLSVGDNNSEELSCCVGFISLSARGSTHSSECQEHKTNLAVRDNICQEIICCVSMIQDIVTELNISHQYIMLTEVF